MVNQNEVDGDSVIDKGTGGGGCIEIYLVVFRVYKLGQPVREGLLEKGRKGRYYLFGLSEETDVEIEGPVIPDEEFSIMKKDLLEVLEANGWKA